MDKEKFKQRKAELELQELELAVSHRKLENWRLQKELDLIKANPAAGGMFTYAGPVIESAVHDLMHRMAIWSNNHPGEPITLTINTQGGTVVDGFALFDFLQQLKAKGHRVTTVGLGLVASMGAILVQAGDERVMSKRTWMMLHEVQGVIEGATSEMKNAMKFNERLQNQALMILSERTTWSARTLKTKWKDDLWLDAKEALKAGLIDRIEGE